MTETPKPHSSLSEILGLQPGDMAAVMGAGGKATVMKRLVIELVAAGTPVLVTGTTNLQSLEDWSGPSLLLSDAEREKADEAARGWATRGAVVWVEKKLPHDMFRGIPVDQVEDLHRQSGGNVLIVKTDGARKRRIKAPRAGEPIIPKGATHGIAVLGLNAVGEKAGPGIVFRFERSCEIGGFVKGQTIEPRHLAALASHPESYPGRFPAGVKRVLYLSHCTGAERLAQAREIWNAVPSETYDLMITGDTVEGKFYRFGDET